MYNKFIYITKPLQHIHPEKFSCNFQILYEYEFCGNFGFGVTTSIASLL